MNKMGILTGVILMIFGVIEQNTLALSIGLSLMIICLAGELYKGRLRSIVERISLHLRIGNLVRDRKQHQHMLQEADEWVNRFAIRYQALLQSAYFLTLDGKIQLRSIEAEKEDGEAVLAEFTLFLRRKGFQVKVEWLRMEINDRIFRNRIGQFQMMLATITEERPTLEELLQIYVEEERRLYSLMEKHLSWNRRILLLYIQAYYPQDEVRQILSRRSRLLESKLTQHLQKLEQELATRIRLGKLEKWLIGTQEEIVVSIAQFDQNVDQFTDFRMGIVYLLEKIGYRVTLPSEASEGIDLLIERSNMRYGVVIKPLSVDDAIDISIIHEAHTVRTLAQLQSMMLITNRSITPPAIQLAKKLGLICIDREKLCEWLNQYTNTFQQSS